MPDHSTTPTSAASLAHRAMVPYSNVVLVGGLQALVVSHGDDM